MSQESVEIVRRSFDAFSQGDVEQILDDLAPEFEMRPSGRFIDAQQTYRGRAGFVDFWNAFHAAWQDMAISIERTEDLDDRVLTLGSFHMTGSGSGAAVDADSAWIHTRKNGRIVHIRSFATWEEALEAAGLSD